MGKIDIHLDKSIPIPLYYQLKEEILNNIKSGVYEQGSMVPKEQDLCDSLGISRTTVRQAITMALQDKKQGDVCIQAQGRAGFY